MKKNNWFFESSSIPYNTVGIKIGFKIKRKLDSTKSPFQKIEIYDTFSFGRALFLDGILQTIEKDEFIYHEMLCHLPLFSHPNPKRVLIVGGGDGGALEEVLKHKIEKVWLVEIDKKVIEFSQKYLFSISKGAFEDKRTEIIIGDGKEFIKNYQNFFDVIILDLSEPLGPAKDLISLKFYRRLKKTLKKNGLISVQSGSFDAQPKLVALIYKRLKKIFPSVKIHRAFVPSYVGEWGFTIASENDLEKLSFKNLEKKFKKLNLNLKYYSPEIHFASGVLPKIYQI